MPTTLTPGTRVRVVTDDVYRGALGVIVEDAGDEHTHRYSVEFEDRVSPDGFFRADELEPVWPDPPPAVTHRAWSACSSTRSEVRHGRRHHGGTAMLTITGWEKRIEAHPEAAHLSRGQRQRLALKIAKRAERMQYVDPDDLIRSILCYADPTGEHAVRNVMAEVAA